MSKTLAEIHATLDIPDGYYRASREPEAPTLTLDQRRQAVTDLMEAAIIRSESTEAILSRLCERFKQVYAPQKGTP